MSRDCKLDNPANLPKTDPTIRKGGHSLLICRIHDRPRRPAGFGDLIGHPQCPETIQIGRLEAKREIP